MAVVAAIAVSAQGLSRVAPVDVAVTYNAVRANHVTSESFWMQGGAVELQARFFHGLGLAARVEGVLAGASTTGAVPLNLVTAVFGPRYTVASHSGRYTVFGEGLVGEANGFHSLFTEGSGPVGSVNAGVTSSANALAVETGGGVDVRLNRRLAVRVLQGNYLRTQFPNATTNVQNSFSVGAGLVLRLGK
jgi:peptidoglycan-associated lipoprotein